MTEVIEDHASKFQRFFIFNSSWGPTEDTENEKIVFFYPEDDVNLHSKHVGLIEALLTFMTVFSEQPASVQHNLKTKTIFREFEPGFCMVLCVAVPYRVKSVNGEVKDTSYSSEKLHDNVLEAILQRTYELFKVFTGGFAHHSLDREAIRSKCSTFFNRFVPNLNFSSNYMNFVNDLFGAVQFLTLEPLDFLHVQSFVNKVENDFACIDKSLFFHHGNIVWSGLQQKETQLLYYYVYNTLLPSYSSKLSGASKNSPFSGHQGKFLTGPTVSLKLTPDEVNSLRIPKVFIPHLDGIKECHFLVYHAIQSTMCLLIPAEVDFTVDFFRRLDGHLGPKLTNMSADLLDVFGRNSSDKICSDTPPSILSPSICVNPVIMETSKVTEDDFDLVYYNDANKAMKNTTAKSGGSASSTKDDIEVQHCIADVNEDITELITNEQKTGHAAKMTTELSIKMANEEWLVARKVDQRQMYLAFKHKANYSLLDITDEVDKVMASEFKNICLPP